MCYPQLTFPNQDETAATTGVTVTLATSHNGNTSDGAQPCNTSGTYYILMKNESTNVEYYFSYYFDSVTDTIYGSQSEVIYDDLYFQSLKTRFIDVQITEISAEPANTVLNFDITYFLELSEISTSSSALNPDLIAVSWSARPSTEFTKTSYDIDQFVQGTSTASTTVVINVLPPGTYDVLIDFNNYPHSLRGEAKPFPETYIYTSFTLNEDGELISTGPVEVYTTDLSVEQSLYTRCAFDAIDGCLKNVIVWLFVPQQSVTTYISDEMAQHSDKVPFNYAYEVYEVVNTLNTSSSSFSGIVLPTSTFSPAFTDFALLPADFWATGTPKEISDVVRPVSELWLYLALFLTLGLRSLAYIRNIKRE